MFGKAVSRPIVFLPGSWPLVGHSRLAELAPLYSTKVESTNGFDEQSTSGSKGPRGPKGFL